jgi:pyridoxal phosphate enzyme (YggS family)
VRTIAENLRDVLERVATAAERAGRRPDSVRILAVSKTQPVDVIREAIAAGAAEIGENYVQEAEAKLPLLPEEPPVVRHFIGHLQKNKAGKAAALFDVVQTVDTVELARALGRRAEGLGKSLDVLIEVNAAGEASKFGVAPEQAVDLAAEIAAVPGLRLRGLMGMGPLTDDERAVRDSFRQLARLFEQLPTEQREVLSMGMTGDFETAIAEGSTMVRIGTGIFGARRSS